MARRPGAHQTATASPVKSCQPWCVIVIPSRRGRQSRVSYATILDSNRAVTELLCADKKLYINKVLADCWLAISALAHTYTRRIVLPLASVVTSGVRSGVDNPKWDLSPGAMQCWWVLLMSPTDEETAVHGCHCWVVWLCAYVGYWPYRGAGTCAPVLKWVLNSYSSTTVDNRNKLSNEVFNIYWLNQKWPTMDK